MQGRKDQKHKNETGNTVSRELDEQALTRDLKRVVEESDLSIPKIASEMGVLRVLVQTVERLGILR